ncbi:hypothetical protein [Nonomuraea candida]|uniref:hypothetical protein n=1 Tax=Nonomuraea candida TaxID=359159 RepID=UPI0005BD30D0|nr:hypothetical protein [Nonomuraea candida]
MRLLACATTTVTAAALALSALAAPAHATVPAAVPAAGPATGPATGPARSVYGFAWADGKGHLRIVPKKAVRETRRTYALKTLPGARELRLDYTGAAYTRVTVACDLKETEGRVAVDAKGLGRTKCATEDLTDTLGLGPVPVRVEHRDGRATRVSEILAGAWPDPRTARGTIKRVNDTTVLFTTGGKRIKLGYSYTTTFHRTTATCGAGWLSGRPVNADRKGLGKKSCQWTDLTKALKTVRHPVLVKVDYTPGVDSLNEVWEVFGDA